MSDIAGPDRRPKIWLDKLTVFFADGASEADAAAYARKQLDSYPPAMAGIEYIPLTALECSDALTLADAACALRRRLGLSPIAFSATERVHLVRFADFVSHFGVSECVSSMGHVYLPERVRYMRRNRWLSRLSHEIAHLSAYLSAEAVLRADAAGGMRAEFRGQRSGMKRVGEDGEVGFIGLDEAATEIAALQIRSLADRMSSALGGISLGGEDRITGYAGQVILVEQLAIQSAAAGVAGWPDHKAVIRSLLIDYLSGSDVFLDALAESAPQTHETLRRLGDSDADNEKAFALSKKRLV